MRRFTLLVLTLGACVRVPDDVTFRCGPDAGCGMGEQCVAIADDSYCVRIDAGTPTPDAGQPDAGVIDAGSFDAGGGDAGSAADAGASDAGAIDAGAGDAGAIDAGGDAGAADAGRAGQICAVGECMGLTCGTMAPTGCVCGCGVGLTCGPTRCEIPQLCEGDWCFEHPLPQGGHLYASWASPTRPLVVGTISAVWGGERGVILEWDGLRTTISRLPSAEHTVVGFFQNANGLHAVTNLAWVYRRAALGWVRSTTHLPPVDINPAGSGGGIVPWSDPCPVFQVTAQGRFLGCINHRGEPQILRVDDTGFVVETLQGVPDSGFAMRPVAFGDLPMHTLFSLHVPGEPTLFKRAAGTWIGYPGPNAISPVAAFAVGGSRVIAGLEFGGFGSTSGVDDAGFYRFDTPGYEVAFNAAVPLANKTALVGATISYLLDDGGFEFLDGGLRADKDDTSMHARRWNAGAGLPEGLLTVGAFGATALFRANGNTTLTSSPFALRPTDLCGTLGGEQVYATYSATAGEPAFFRPDDLIRLDERDEFRGIARRLPGGAWRPYLGDSRSADAGWRNSLDQCAVHASGLTTASPLALTTFAPDGGTTTATRSFSFWRDAGAPLVPAFESLWVEGGLMAMSGPGIRGVVDSSSKDGQFVVDYSLGPAAVYGIGSERLVTGADGVSNSLYRLMDGTGLTGLAQHAEQLTGSANHRTALWGDADAGFYVALSQTPAGLTQIWRRPACASPNSSTCQTFTPLGQLGIRFPAGQHERVSSLFMTPSRRLYWLRTSDDRLNFRGGYYSPRSTTVDLEWVDGFTADAGAAISSLPLWVHQTQVGRPPYVIWVTPTHVLVMTSRGIVSRPIPP